MADLPTGMDDGEVRTDREVQGDRRKYDRNERVSPMIDPSPGPPTPHAEYSTVHDPNCCQVCRQVFPNIREKAIHVTLAHDLGRSGSDQTLKFAACEACGRRVYISLDTCECGQPMKRSW
jgi:hypothetical protein